MQISDTDAAVDLPTRQKPSEVVNNGTDRAGGQSAANQPDYDRRIQATQRAPVEMNLVGKMGHGRRP